MVPDSMVTCFFVSALCSRLVLTVVETSRCENIHETQIIQHPGVGEVIPKNYEVRVGKDTICYIYEPVGCHSYNIIKIGTRDVKIATIDTMLSFYLAFLYGYTDFGDDYKERIICMSQFLFEVQQKMFLTDFAM